MCRGFGGNMRRSRTHANTDRLTVKERVDYLAGMLRLCAGAPCKQCLIQMAKAMQDAVRQALARNDRRTKAGR